MHREAVGRSKLNYSLCCPIHNESKYLRHVIPSWLKLNPRPSEFILVFDRCSDGSEEICRKILGELNYKFIIKEKSDPQWNCQVAHNRQLAFNSASFNIILNTDADVILDPKITEYFSLVGTLFDVISFRRVDYYRRISNISSRPYIHHLSSLIIGLPRAGVYTIWKPSWQKVGFNKKVPYYEDLTLMCNLIEQGFRHHYVAYAKLLHLREKGGFSSIKNDFVDGIYRRKCHVSTWQVILSTLIFRTPALLSGYLYAQRLENLQC